MVDHVGQMMEVLEQAKLLLLNACTDVAWAAMGDAHQTIIDRLGGNRARDVDGRQGGKAIWDER